MSIDRPIRCRHAKTAIGNIKYFIAEGGHCVIVSRHTDNLEAAKVLYRHLFVGKRVHCGNQVCKDSLA